MILRRLALLLAAGLAAAAEPAIACPGLPAGQAVALLVAHGIADTDIDPGLLLAGGGDQPVRFALAGSGADAARQALAHALGAWLVPAGDGSWLVGRDRRLPVGRLAVHAVPSTLLQRSELEDPVRALLEPWLGGHAGIGYHPVDGSWTGTLDAEGRRRLDELVTALERPRPSAPTLVPDQPTLPTGIAGPLPAAPWATMAPAIARAWSVSVAVAPEIAADAPALPASDAAGLPAALAAAGLQAAWRRGVLCIGREPPQDRLHPGLRRRLAVLPVAHLTNGAAGAAALAQELTTTVAPWAWRQSGWGILAEGTTLLVAADVPTIHAVLDALGERDRADPAQAVRAQRLPAAPPPAILPP